jgi:hypothetical protein
LANEYPGTYSHTGLGGYSDCLISYSEFLANAIRYPNPDGDLAFPRSVERKIISIISS